MILMILMMMMIDDDDDDDDDDSCPSFCCGCCGGGGGAGTGTGGCGCDCVKGCQGQLRRHGALYISILPQNQTCELTSTYLEKAKAKTGHHLTM